MKKEAFEALACKLIQRIISMMKSNNQLYQVHKYYNHLKEMIKMAVILMDLLHTEILLRFILLSNVTFEFVSIFCRQFARLFFPFLVGLVR